MEDLFLEEDGVLSFERFMEEALYHPRFGYYSSNIVTVGRRGDFSTSATLHDVLAQAVVKWAVREKKESLGAGFGKRWHVIEVGAGDGSLARDFLKHVSLAHRPLLCYHIVETSLPLKDKQRENLPKLQMHWHDSMQEALSACDGKALIISNELVDAFPACVLQWDSGRRSWKELHLRDQGNAGLSEELHALSQDREGLSSTVLGPWDAEITALKDGQRCEVHWSYQKWLNEWLPLLEQGSLLTIDYGDVFPQVYHRRPRGTTRGYFQGVRAEGEQIYDRFGHQDLTADVNFSDLREWGESADLTTIDFLTQREFLLRELPRLEDPAIHRQDAALEHIMSPYGAGEAFKVLWQRKGS